LKRAVDSTEETDFRSSVLKCIDSGLDVLGEVSKQVVYSYLAQNKLSREMIPDEPWKFTETLKTLFGRGEEVLEKTIVAELKRAFDITSNGGMLVEILATARLRRGPAEKPAGTHGRTRKSHGIAEVGKA
jgi:hypothetical protein